jgi:hypothetical protein
VREKTDIPPGDPDYHAKYRELKRDKLKQQARDYRRSSNARLWSATKRRAFVKNVPFSIEVSDIQIPETCPVLGIPLSVGDGKKHHGSPSLDRFIPELGYVPGNVRVISDRANTLKSDGTINEFEKVLEFLKNG